MNTPTPADAFTPAAPPHTPPTIDIDLDGQARTVPVGSSLADLVAALGHAEQAVATAVNQSFVARSQRAQTVLRSGDQVLLFQPIVGG